jgi:magnesium chelatase subunit H
VEFQTLQGWGANKQGLLPLESTIMIAIPELDGGTTPMVFGGVRMAVGCAVHRLRSPLHLAGRRARCGRCRVAPSAPKRWRRGCSSWPRCGARQRRSASIGVVLFNFPPNGGAAGTAQFLAVFESLHATLAA